MKVGIVTFHRALNYGAVLQAYALNKFFSNNGIDSRIVDYRSPNMEIFYKPIKANPFKSPRVFLKELIYAPRIKSKRKKFEAFIKKNIPTSPVYTKYDDLKCIVDDYDCFISGSDQVWNYKWMNMDEAFFLGFAPNGKKSSYAASFGFSQIPDEYKAEYKRLLEGFKHISVRESDGKTIVEDLLGRENVEVSVDPTCLISADMWNEIASESEENGYVLLYLLEKSEYLINYAKELARMNNTKVVIISDAIKKISGLEYKSFIGPDEFVGLFKNAKYVVTNSFHGLMFSVIFEKEFYVMYQQYAGAPNSRLINFVDEYGLEERVLSQDQPVFTKKIDYSRVREILELHRQESLDYVMSLKENYEEIDLINDAKLVPMAKDECCGCGSCMSICPCNAITMKPDNEGFLYPCIDDSKCIKCKKCVSACAFMEKENVSSGITPRAYVAKNKNMDTRMKSRSGGVFVAISDICLENGGVVYGVALDEDFGVYHTVANTKEERNRFCGSKYVQSDTRKAFESAGNDLKNGKVVLFSGTGCQIDALKKHLTLKKIPLDNLVTVDIVCHGVMSPQLWRDNICYIKSNNNGEITNVDFRDKSFGWNSHIESYIAGGKQVNSELYTSIFYQHTALRPSCYNCHYTSIYRDSDITLADAWGIQREMPDFNDNKGVSLIIVNSPKGQQHIDATKGSVEYVEVELKNYMQPNLQNPTHKPKNRESFWDEYRKKGFLYVAKKSFKAQLKLKKRNKNKARIVAILRKLKIKK